VARAHELDRGFENVFFGYGYDLVNQADHVREVQRSEGLGPDAVGDGLAYFLGGPLDEAAGAERLAGVARQFRLHADDSDRRPDRLDGGRDAADEAAAADRDDHR
jgi:hypothetical protein